MGRDLERNFERFRNKGDVKALAKIFDRTGRDLLRLAQHLVHHMGDAEDLVQSTFVTAIDRAQTYDPKRPLKPWLTGILSRHAANLIRRRQTRKDSHQEEACGLLDVASSGDCPVDSATSRELAADLTVALQRLPEHYRRILEPYLLHSQRPEEIARSLDEAPGTVRTQLHRGLERLRRILPASALVASVSATRGWSAMRSSVLRHAEYSIPTLVASAGVAVIPISLGGVFMAQKAILAVGLAAVACLGYAVYPASEGSLSSNTETPKEVDVVPEDLADNPAAVLAAGRSPEEVLQEPVESIESGPRVSVTRGEHWVEGRLFGVLPKHLAEIQAQLIFSSKPEQPERVKDAEITLDNAQGLLEDRFSGLRASWITEMRTLSTVDGSVVTSTAPAENAFELKDLEFLEGGTFRVPISKYLQAKDGIYRLRFKHELYTNGMVPLALEENSLDRVKQGEVANSQVEISMSPLAIVRGEVTLPKPDKDQEETEEEEENVGMKVVFWTPPPVEEAPILDLLDATLKTEGLRRDMERISFQLVLMEDWLKPRIAIYEPGQTKPLAEVNLDEDGKFELKVPVEGELVLVAFSKKGRVLSRTVFLTLAEATELSDPLRFEHVALLGGFAQHFGLYPDGGLNLVAERKVSEDAVKFLNRNLSLVWQGLQVVRMKAQAETDAAGRFVFKTVSPGTFTVGFDPEDADPIFSMLGIEEATATARTPDGNVALSLPVAAMRFEREEVVDSASDKEREAVQFTVQVADESDGEFRDKIVIALNPGQAQTLLCLPNERMRLRRMIAREGESEGALVWSGQSGVIGTRSEVVLRP